MKNFLILVIVALILILAPIFAGYSQELQDAYNFAYKNGITTMNSIDKADMNGGLTRIAMAKMLSQYAINILGKSPDKSKIITFPDVSSKLDDDYNNGVKLAYQLGIMGIGIDKFRPYDSVTRAEFGTALSRVLYGDIYNQNGNNYYSKHLDALKNAGIMTKIDTPFQGEIRGYVMLMLMRSNGTGNVNCNDPIIVLGCAGDNSYCPKECSKYKQPYVTNIIKEETDEKGYYTIEVYYSDGTSLKSHSSHDGYRKITHKIGTMTEYNEHYCQVKFLDWDGSVIKDDEIRQYGTEFSDIEKPKNPTRSSDNGCIYVFSGWSNTGKIEIAGNTLTNCRHFAEYTCEIAPKLETYTVTRKDADGSILQKNDLKKGDDMPVYKGSTPKKNNYVFIGWEGGMSSEQFKYGEVEENMVFSAIFSDEGVEVPSVAKYAGSGCRKYTDSPRHKFKRDYKGITFLDLPKQVVKDGWYFIGCDNAVNNGSNGKDSLNGNSSTNDSQSDNVQTNNETNNNENTNTQPDNTSPGNTTQNDENNDNEGNSNNNENSNESNNSESSDNSNNSSNCVDIEVDDGNSYNFCIVKWKSNGSKYSIKVDNAKDLSLCSVGYSKSGQSWDFYDCDGDITNWKDSGILYDVTLLIKYNGKNYFSQKLNYDLTNGVFVDN